MYIHIHVSLSLTRPFHDFFFLLTKDRILYANLSKLYAKLQSDPFHEFWLLSWLPFPVEFQAFKLNINAAAIGMCRLWFSYYVFDNRLYFSKKLYMKRKC